MNVAAGDGIANAMQLEAGHSARIGPLRLTVDELIEIGHAAVR